MSASRRLIAILLLTGLSGLAASGARAEDEAEAFDLSQYDDANACVFTNSIRDFSVIDRRNLVIEASGRRTYLVTLFSSCFGLNFAHSLAFSSTSGRICGNSNDKIYLGRGEVCRINGIIRVESEEIAEKIVEARASDSE
ncbi:MAG: DUF6491 family protein [Pseudomonadota bacterium]